MIFFQAFNHGYGPQPPPPQPQQQQRMMEQNMGKFSNPTFGGHVPPASRHSQQPFSAQITRQANTGWLPGSDYHRPPPSGPLPRVASGEKSPTVMTSSNNGPWKNIDSSTSNLTKDSLKGLVTATACKNCRKEANFMCSACKSVHYCSLDCQVSYILIDISPD